MKGSIVAGSGAISKFGSGQLPRSRLSSRSLARSFQSALLRKSVATLSPQWHYITSISRLNTSRRYTTTSNINAKITGVYFTKADPTVCDPKELTKAQIAEQFDLQYRDLRDIDLRSEAATRILVRPATILVQFFDLCVIIQADEAILIDRVNQDKEEHEDEEDRTSITEEFKECLAKINDPTVLAVNASSQLPYEFHVLEAAFVAVLSRLRAELTSAREDAEESARHLTLEEGLAAVGLDQLFERSQRLNKIEQKARLLRETVSEVLDTDEDLAAMYISDALAGKPHAVSDHQEAEYMLEAYHRAADNLAESASSAHSAIRKKEANFRSALAVQRNQIMFLEARISIYTLGTAGGTLIAGLFGMNLINYAEEAPWGFPLVTAACIISSALISAFGARRLRRITTLREIQQSYMLPEYKHARRK